MPRMKRSADPSTKTLLNESQTTPARKGPTYEIVMGHSSQGWTARCYLHDGEHVWSSEGAVTAQLALREIAEAIERRQ